MLAAVDRHLRIALVEPYLGGSHQAWAEGYAAHTSHDVEVFGLPAIHWKWRMRGGHVTLSDQIAEAVVERGPFDVLVASSMTDLAGLLGIARRSLGEVRTVLFMHENQLTFPRPEHDHDLSFAMTNWTSMLAADLVVFNSEYHRREWFAALPGFLARLPDHRHSALIESVAERSMVLPVGSDLRALGADENARPDAALRRPLVLWNQRWEYDKGPSEFVEAVEALLTAGCDVDVALAGDHPADEPPERRYLRQLLGRRLVHDGYADDTDYPNLLRRADFVVSTAHHEFFGVAITEAVFAGAFPVLPDRLAYPERIPARHHADCLYGSGDELVELLRRALDDPAGRAATVAALRPVMAELDWSRVAERYDAAFAP